MSTNNLFNRTVKTNIIKYQTDGMGRDGYINYNNAGFWKENIKQIVPKETFARPSFAVFHSLKSIPPIWTYYSDGSGRDSYVYYNNGGLKKKFSPLAGQTLQNFLREKIIDNEKNPHQKIHLSRDEKIYLNKIKQIQKNIVNRLYNQYNYKLQNNRYRYNNNFMNNNTLHRSSSQIIGRQTLEPIKNNINSLDGNESNNLNSSNNNINSSPKNIGTIKLKSIKKRNKNPYYFKREYISCDIDNRLTKHPKIKCSLEADKLNENENEN
jgi:hypothetical protein